MLFLTEKMKELTDQDDVHFPVKLLQPQRLIDNISMDECRCHLAAIPEEVKTGVPELVANVDGVHVLRLDTVRGQEPQVLAETVA